MTEPVPRIITGATIGPVDATRVPRYAGPATFARLPRLDEVSRADVAVLGVPFDSGVSYRPGARFGPGTCAPAPSCCGPTTRRWTLPVRQPAGGRRRRHRRQPVRLAEAIETIDRGGRDLRADGAQVLTLGGDHTIALPCSCARWPATTGRWPCCTSTPTSTPGTPTSARRTRTAPRSGGPARRGSSTSSARLHVGIRGPLYSGRDLEDDAVLGFQVVRSDDYEVDGVAGVVERMRRRLADGPVYVSVDIDVLDPAHAPGTGTPEAGGLTSRELLNTLRALVGVDVVGADIVEVSPPYDHAELTGIAAAHVGYELLSDTRRRIGGTWVHEACPS
jgi:agmatinase